MSAVRRIPGVKGQHRHAVLAAYPGKPGKCRCHQYRFRHECDCDQPVMRERFDRVLISLDDL